MLKGCRETIKIYIYKVILHVRERGAQSVGKHGWPPSECLYIYRPVNLLDLSYLAQSSRWL